MSVAFLVCLAILFGLSAIGAPIALAMIAAAVGYLAMVGQDLALASEQILQGLYNSFILLAVPLFIVAANIMNAGTISDRLLNFCVAAVGRFRGGLGHVNVVASLIFSGDCPSNRSNKRPKPHNIAEIGANKTVKTKNVLPPLCNNRFGA